ncbi:TetR/AcrR family transcriptional regulator [Octadecabacter sp. 1_MG-2023]|uniref:TetR/AcrR family transcriptional regulator n=1 Tax=unclassified Octadecabacter TaxID=196158 RepID=UPI001C0A087A|nr:MULTISPECIES: TetR/AcrR family transcriptional regulator [unclassified Octadecabacter]MBU2992503.1 TetR/AcrR family transcriptional regulator [Octadecabacter sp. B2R22]MDO6734740.1 TetR/AcrR family transcriptional regulator [Octadecabacter sp. 1_MG-2023]
MADGPPEVKRGRKFDQVLHGARDIFMSDGFEGASVDDIAKASGVSKATLYSYFPDKRLLFMEVAKSECIRQADEAVASIDMSLPVATVLTSAAWQMVRFFTSDFGQRVYRLCVGEGDRFPELGQEFYKSGPALVRDRLIEFLKVAISRNELEIDDLPLAADQFHELCKADLFPRLIFNMDTSFSDDDKQRIVTGAVETFLARYAK